MDSLASIYNELLEDAETDEFEKTASENDEDLDNYIIDARSKGYSDDEIIESLNDDDDDDDDDDEYEDEDEEYDDEMVAEAAFAAGQEQAIEDYLEKESSEQMGYIYGQGYGLQLQEIEKEAAGGLGRISDAVTGAGKLYKKYSGKIKKSLSGVSEREAKGIHSSAKKALKDYSKTDKRRTQLINSLPTRSASSMLRKGNKASLMELGVSSDQISKWEAVKASADELRSAAKKISDKGKSGYKLQLAKSQEDALLHSIMKKVRGTSRKFISGKKGTGDQGIAALKRSRGAAYESSMAKLRGAGKIGGYGAAGLGAAYLGKKAISGGIREAKEAAYDNVTDAMEVLDHYGLLD